MGNALKLEEIKHKQNLMKLRARGLSTAPRNVLEEEIRMLHMALTEVNNAKNIFLERCTQYEGEFQKRGWSTPEELINRE